MLMNLSAVTFDVLAGHSVCSSFFVFILLWIHVFDVFSHIWTRKAGSKKQLWFVVLLLVLGISSLRVQKCLRLS